MFILEGPRSNWDFGWELALQVRVIFFRWDLKTPCIKNREYKSQAKKVVLILISTISHFWSPNNFLVVFVSLFSMVDTPHYWQIFFGGGGRGLNFFSRLVARDWEDLKFLGDLLYLGDLISFLEEGVWGGGGLGHFLP